MRDYIKPSMVQKPEVIVLHTGTNDLKNNKTLSSIASETIQLGKSIETNGIEVAVSSLLSRGDKLSEKVRKVTTHVQEKCTTENFGIIQHTKVNSKRDLFPGKLHRNKKGQGILKGNFRRLISDCRF